MLVSAFDVTMVPAGTVVVSFLVVVVKMQHALAPYHEEHSVVELQSYLLYVIVKVIPDTVALTLDAVELSGLTQIC